MKSKLFKLLYCFFIVPLFFSCSNAALFDELTKAIDYANADYVSVTISALNSYTESIIPSAGVYNDKYKNGDVIDLSFKVNSGYQFLGWRANPADCVFFEDTESVNTKVTIKTEGKSVLIEPVVEERPMILATSPNYEVGGVDGSSNVHIVFSQPMSLDSIINGPNFDIYIGQKSVRDLYFDTPYFLEDSNNTELIIPTKKDTTYQVPSYTEIKVEIKKEVENEKKSTLAKDFSFRYKTNGKYDIEAPKVTLSDVGCVIADKRTKFSFFDNLGNATYAYYRSFYKVNLEEDVVDESLDSFVVAKKIYLKGGTFLDNDAITDVFCVITPYKNNNYPDEDNNVIKLQRTFNQALIDSGDFIYDFSSLDIQGIFKVTFEFYDAAGNMTEIKDYNGYPYMVLIDNHFNFDTSKIKITDYKTSRKGGSENPMFIKSATLTISGTPGSEKYSFLTLERKSTAEEPFEYGYNDLVNRYGTASSSKEDAITSESLTLSWSTTNPSFQAYYLILTVKDAYGNLGFYLIDTKKDTVTNTYSFTLIE